MSVDEAEQETTDAALARALQMEEYEEPRPKKQRTAFEDVSDPARSLAERLDTMFPGAELTESELSDRITPLGSEDEEIFLPSISDSEEEIVSPADERDTARRRARAFRPLLRDEGDAEDEDLPTWEEQRKIRRVSLRTWAPTYTATDLSF